MQYVWWGAGKKTEGIKGSYLKKSLQQYAESRHGSTGSPLHNALEFGFAEGNGESDGF